MKSQIKDYFENLAPQQLGLKEKIKVSSVEKIGAGANNINFLVVANNKKFIFRLNVLLKDRKKTRDEYNSLKLVERLDIAPKPWVIDDSRKVFDSDFIILDYISGKELGKMHYSLNSKLIKKLVELFYKFHSLPIRGNLLKLSKEETSYNTVLNKIKKLHNSISKDISDKKALSILLESYENLKEKSLRKKVTHPLVFAHGDIQEHNIIAHRGKLEVVDFEGVCLTDPASEIAYTLTQFSSKKEFSEKQKEIFFKEYLKLRQDPTLRERVETFMPLKNFSDLLWAIEQALKVKHKRVHKSYINKNVFRDTVGYAQMVFGRCVRDGTIDKKYEGLDLMKVLR